MIDSFEMQKRYFTSQLDQLKSKPELNRARIADCEYYLDMLNGSSSMAEFMKRIKETGNMVSTAKAESHDRYDNRAFIYDSLSQKRKAAEDRLRLDIIDSSQTHAELSQKLEDFEQHSRPSYNENKSIGSIVSIVSALFQLCTDAPGSNDEQRSIVKFETYWKQLIEADPDASWQKVITYPPYRDRIIFTDEQLSTLERKFREVSSGLHS